MPEGIDYAFGRPTMAVLKSAGIKFVCRYLSHSPSKNLTAAEARKLTDAGIWVVVVWETTAKRALDGHAAGAADAKDARAQARACGMPDDRPVYFAVDWDASSGQQNAINSYLDGAASVLGRDQVGIYGGYGPVKRALDGEHAKWAWQTYAWSGGRWDSRAQLQQCSNGHTIGGVGCDYDRSKAGDYGQWRVGVTPGEDDMALVSSLGVDGELVIAVGTTADVKFTVEYERVRHDENGRIPDQPGGQFSVDASNRLRFRVYNTAGVPVAVRDCLARRPCSSTDSACRFRASVTGGDRPDTATGQCEPKPCLVADLGGVIFLWPALTDDVTALDYRCTVALTGFRFDRSNPAGANPRRWA